MKLTPKEIVDRQQMVLKKLAATMQEKGHSLEEAARAAGLSYSYLVGLKNGQRHAVRSDVTRVQKIADYLDVPLVQIYIWGGFFKPIDFIAKRTMKDGVSEAFDRMSNDSIMATMVPSAMDWNNPRKWSDDAKLTLALLYEKLSDQIFLKHAYAELNEEPEMFS